MKTFRTHTLVLVVLASILWAFLGTLEAISFLLGGLLGFANFCLLFLLLKQIFEKKHVALASLIIVFKYAILGLIIYFLVVHTQIHVLWLGIGVGSLLITLAFTGQSLEQLVKVRDEVRNAKEEG
jgi:hypothetical protein